MKGKINNSKKYVIGIDGGATKTVAILADCKGDILAYGRSGSSSPRNIGIKKSAQSIAEAIRQALIKTDKNSEIISVFIGLPAVQEEFRLKKGEIKKELLRQKGLAKLKKSKIEINSDQIAAFRSGTDEKNGVLVIAGTGHVVHGWKKGKEYCASGWGWLNDEGSAFWIGHRSLEAVFKHLDGRGPATLITKLISKNYPLKPRTFFSGTEKVSKKEETLLKIYSDNFIEVLASFSIMTSKAAEKGDKIAKLILEQAGKETSLAANTVIKKMGFEKQKFPLILIGGVFKSKFSFKEFEKQVKKVAPAADFILPKQEPAFGAVKLAIEQIEKI